MLPLQEHWFSFCTRFGGRLVLTVVSWHFEQPEHQVHNVFSEDLFHCSRKGYSCVILPSLLHLLFSRKKLLASFRIFTNPTIMLKCKNVLIKRTEVCLYAVSKSSKWKKVQATDFSQLTRNINQAKTYYLKQPKITFCKTCSTSNCVFHSSVMEECKSLLKQCLDDAFASDRTTHYSSLVSSKTIKRFCQNYSQLDEISKRLLLLFLCQEYSVKHSKVASASELFLKNLHHKVIIFFILPKVFTVANNVKLPTLIYSVFCTHVFQNHSDWAWCTCVQCFSIMGAH